MIFYVTDIDGTLKSNKAPLSENTKRLIKECEEKGVLISTATARGFNSALSALDKTVLKAPMISLSGAEIYYSDTDEIKRFPIDSKTVLTVGKQAEKTGADVFYYYAAKSEKELLICSDELKTEGGKRFKKMRDFPEKQSFALSKTPYFAPKNSAKNNEYECLYIVCVGDESDIKAIFETAVSGKNLNYERFNEHNSTACYLEICSKEGGKGNVAKRLKNELFCDEIISFGDNLNDLSMKKVSERFYASEESCDLVKNEANGVLIGDDAVMKFIAFNEGVSNEGVSVNQATDCDIFEIAKLEKENFSEFYSEKTIIQTLNNGFSKIFTAKVCGMLCGYVIIDFLPDFAEILKIFVKPEFRGKGLAKLLHNECVLVCKENKTNKILLEVRSKNLAKEFYNRLGYKVDGVRKNYYKNPDDDAVLMSLDLKKEEI